MKGLGFTINIGGVVQKHAAATEVVGSSIRVLTVLGFSRDEIAELFDRHLEGAATATEPEPIDEPAPSEDKDDGWYGGPPRYEIDSAFQKTEVGKTLTRIGKRMEALGDLREPENAATAETLLRTAMPLLGQGATWFEATCRDRGVPFARDRDLWLKTATDADLDSEEQRLFLDRSALGYAFNVWRVEQYARAAATLGRGEPLAALLDQVRSSGWLPSRSVAVIEDAVQQAAMLPKARDIVGALTTGEERIQADLVRELQSALGLMGDEHLIRQWLEVFAADGLIERYKKSGKWCVRRA